MKCENLVSKFACKSSATCLCRYGAESSAIFISFINIFSGLIFLTKKASPRFVDVLTWFNCLLIMGAIIVYSLFIVSEVWPYMFKTAKDVKERIRKQNKKEGEGEDDDAPAEAGVEAGAAGGEGGGTGAHPGLTNRAGGKKDDGKKQGWWSRSKPSTPKKKASVKKAGADRQDNEEEEEEEDVAGLFEAGNVERTDAMKRKDAQQGSVLAAVVGKNMLRITRIRNQVKAGLCKWNAVHLVDPQLESAWFQPLNLSSEKLVSKFAFKLQLVYATPGRRKDDAAEAHPRGVEGRARGGGGERRRRAQRGRQPRAQHAQAGGQRGQARRAAERLRVLHAAHGPLEGAG
jgi:hypothetical protein